MKFAVAVFLLLSVFAVCGDKICESAEIGSCIDCATINTNYVCDNFENDLKNYDPDCNTSVGQMCYSSEFNYSDGMGTSCYPGNCTEGTGCVASCSDDSQCESGFCVTGTCEKTCDGCDLNTSSYEVYPLSTAIYLGNPTFVSFRINRVGAGPTVISVEARGPCTLSYEDTVDVGTGWSVSVIKIDDCAFSGVGSIEVTVNSEAWGTVHFLSYSALLYSQGEMPHGVTGFSSMSNRVDGSPVEVKTWVG